MYSCVYISKLVKQWAFKSLQSSVIGRFYTFTIVLMLLASCNRVRDAKLVQTDDLDSIYAIPTYVETHGKLVALLDNSISSYYIFKGQPRGFEYELLKWFCRDHDLHLEVKIMPTFDHAMDSLLAGKGDVVAANLTITGERARRLHFTPWLLRTRQMLVQRKPADNLKTSSREYQAQIVGEYLELEGKTVYVHRRSAFYERLQNLIGESGVNINIALLDDDVDVEEMIEKVDAGIIGYTVVDENISNLYRHLYPNLHFDTPLSLRQSIGWATRAESDTLQQLLSDWIIQHRNSAKFAVIYRKYFHPTRSKLRDMQSSYNLSRGGSISPYDSYFQSAAEHFQLDWKLLAALSFQESKFNAEARSAFGAVGLMQLLPNTAARFGTEESLLLNPEMNIRAGAGFLKYLVDFWEERTNDSSEAIKFALASYNAGLGHVQDAVRLAAFFELDTLTWNDNVEFMLRKKTSPKYYKHPVVRHGYCRGYEPVQYVTNVLGFHRQYVMVAQPQGANVAGP